MGVLKSALFTSGDEETNKKLENCAIGSPSEVASHFTVGSPGGDHIKRLQTALLIYKNSHHNEIFEGQPIGDFPRDGQYSPAFADAVFRYKGIKGIKNYANQIDRIVGKKTILSLDSEMPVNPLPDFPIVPIGPGGRIVLRLSGECLLIGDKADDIGADDMKFGDRFDAVKGAGMRAACIGLLQVPDDVLENTMRATMVSALVATGTGDVSSPAAFGAGVFCVEHFISGGGATHVFGSGVSEAAATNNGLETELLANAQALINSEVRRSWDRGVIDDRAIAEKLKRERRCDNHLVKMSGVFLAFIGGIHAYTLKLCNLQVDEFDETFSYALDVEALDHFGVDDGDVSNSPVGASLMSFFMLQHFSADGAINRRLARYRPFRTVLRTRVKTKEKRRH